MRTKLHSWRGKLLRVSSLAIIRVRYPLSMEIGKAEVHTYSRGVIQFIRRDIVAKHIPAVIGKPEFFCKRVPVKTNGISDSLCQYLQSGTVMLHPHNCSESLILLNGNIR